MNRTLLRCLSILAGALAVGGCSTSTRNPGAEPLLHRATVMSLEGDPTSDDA